MTKYSIRIEIFSAFKTCSSMMNRKSRSHMAVYDAKKASIWYAKNHTVATLSRLKNGKNNAIFYIFRKHSLIRGVLIQRGSAGAKNFTNYVFCHPQFSSVIQNIENRCAILTPVCLCRLLST